MQGAASDCVSLSSRVDDGSAYASAWRNVVIPFPKVVKVPAGSVLQVTTVADLRKISPSYAFKVVLGQEVILDMTLSNLYPYFSQPKVH